MTAPVILLASLSWSASPTIDLYDLTYALKFDKNAPAQIAAAWDHCHTVATLQGIVNRKSPRLYIRFVNAHGQNIDDYWLNILTRRGGWLARRRIVPIPDILTLLKRYRKEIKGAVVYDANVPATSNLASTIAGVEDLIAVRYDPSPQSLYSALIKRGPRLPVIRKLINDDGSPMFTGRGTIRDTDIASTGSAKCDAYLWMKHHYIDSGKVDAHWGAHYIDAYWLRNPAAAQPNHHTLTNHDFFVANKAFFFDLDVWADEIPIDDPDQKLGTDLETLKALLKSAYDQAGKDRMIHIGGFTPWAFKYTEHKGAGGKHHPVHTEWELARVVSAYNGYIDADAIGFGAMANASFYQHFPLRKRYPQRWTNERELTKHKYLDENGKINFDDREFLIFYVGDYDCAAWLYQWIPLGWDHPARGKIPLMWCISPMLDQRAPMAMHYMRRTATKNDYFAASDNGAGYLNPGMLQEPRPISNLPSGLDAWAKHCEMFYKRWDLTITGFIIDGFAPGLNQAGFDCYARFSPNGIVPQKILDERITPSKLHGDMPVLRFDHDLPHDPEEAAKRIVERVKKRGLPFHWFRAILKSPDWYVQVTDHTQRLNPKIELLDAPTFWELYRIYLKQNPDAANGKIPAPL